FICSFITGSLQANAEYNSSSLGEILKDSNGRDLVVYYQWDAYRLCKERGQRLPTARELAHWAVESGASILEKSEVRHKPRGYELIRA
ncbi:hypothetical protein, partial [Streptococcus pneumoniae]|uniref:hypothetical protein n=1 Tax=Streptococcus pneumoniae TaxID=1313 RepID=UPI001E47DA59